MSLILVLAVTPFSLLTQNTWSKPRFFGTKLKTRFGLIGEAAGLDPLTRTTQNANTGTTMHVIAKKKLRDFYRSHPQAKLQLDAWWKMEA